MAELSAEEKERLIRETMVSNMVNAYRGQLNPELSEALKDSILRGYKKTLLSGMEYATTNVEGQSKTVIGVKDENGVFHTDPQTGRILSIEEVLYNDLKASEVLVKNQGQGGFHNSNGHDYFPDHIKSRVQFTEWAEEQGMNEKREHEIRRTKEYKSLPLQVFEPKE